MNQTSHWVFYKTVLTLHNLKGTGKCDKTLDKANVLSVHEKPICACDAQAFLSCLKIPLSLEFSRKFLTIILTLSVQLKRLLSYISEAGRACFSGWLCKSDVICKFSTSCNKWESCNSVTFSEYFVKVRQFKWTKGSCCSVDVVVLAMMLAGFRDWWHKHSY